jgi:hypothetical protein
MRKICAAVATAGLALAAVFPASAADLTAAPGPIAAPQGCDFFEAELISYLCAKTAYVGVFGGGSNFTHTFNTPFPGGVSTQKFTSKQADEGGSVSITPFEGFRVTLEDEAFQYKNTQTRQNVVFGGPPLPAFTGTANGSQGGWFSAGAEYTLWDKSNDYGRFITNIVGYVETFPGGGPYQSRDLQMLGWNSGAKFALNVYGLSINYFGNTLFQHYDNPGETRISSYSRLLLANDALGIGVGPRLATITELWHAPGVNTGWSDTRLGGEVLLEPFRTTQIAYLKDVTLDGYYVHSIGQANLVPNWNGSASAYEFGGSARFNFRF